MSYTHSHRSTNGTTYYLNSIHVRFKGQPSRIIYFFSKDRRDRTTGCELPNHRKVTENPKTGVPFLKANA